MNISNLECLDNNSNVNDVCCVNSSELFISTFKSRSKASEKVLKLMGLQDFLEATVGSKSIQPP